MGMESKKQTAVEFLVKQLGIKLDGWNNQVIQQAKEMEKQQIEDANLFGWQQGLDESVTLLRTEQYYN